MKFSELSLLAIAIKTDVRTARSIMGVSNSVWKSSKLSVQNELGFPLFLPNSAVPTSQGQAWGEIAYRVYQKSEELRKIAEPLCENEKRKRDIETGSILSWKHDAATSKWVGVGLASGMGFVTLHGSILLPTLEELCDLIKRLNNLSSILRQTSPSATSPTTLPSSPLF